MLRMLYSQFFPLLYCTVLITGNTPAHLSFSSCPQCVDQLQFGVSVGGFIDELAALFHHGLDGHLELSPSLGENHDILIECFPILGVVA